MNCPYCKEELGLNNICINPSCSHFSSSFNDNNTYETNIQKDEEKTYADNLNNNNTEYLNFNDQSSFNSSLISDEEFEFIIGKKNRDYYMKYLKQYKAEKKFTSWNWACFFFGPYWLFYRKMFVFGIGYLVLNCIINLLIAQPISFVLRITLSVFANCLYLYHCEAKIKKQKSSYDIQNPNYYNSLRKKGGTSLAVPLIIMFIYIILILIVVFSVLSFSTAPYYVPYDIPSKVQDYYF